MTMTDTPSGSPFADTVADEVAAHEATQYPEHTPGSLVQHANTRPADLVESDTLGTPGTTTKVTAAPIGWVVAPLRGKWHTDQAAIGGAWTLMSPDKRHRYAVRRMVEETPSTVAHRRLVFVTLRPQGGDAETNDRDINRARQIAAREGAAEVVVVSLFGLRNGPLEQSDDPIGPGNQDALQTILAPPEGTELAVIACWGSKVPSMYRAYVDEWRQALGEYGAMCFGLSANGQPMSLQSDIRADAPLVPLASA